MEKKYMEDKYKLILILKNQKLVLNINQNKLMNKKNIIKTFKKYKRKKLKKSKKCRKLKKLRILQKYKNKFQHKEINRNCEHVLDCL